jgi:hypothetical protein
MSGAHPRAEVKLSDDQKKPEGGGSDDKKLPGPLPGLGGQKPGGAAPLPGAKSGGAAPLPGLGGAKPGGAAPLPGLGGHKKEAAPLPGLGGPKADVIPPFMEEEIKKKEAAARQEQAARDPFTQSNLPPRRPSYMPDEGLIGEAKDVKFSEREAGRSRLPLIVGGLLLVLICLFLGYLGGTAVSGRVALNIAIRDAYIVEYELKKAGKKFDEVQNMVTAAFQKAAKREYHPEHIKFLSEELKGNPLKPQIFTERNYKNFDAAAVQWLTDYNTKWGKLYDLVEEHRRKTQNDEKALKAAGEEFKKLLETNYGVVFTRDTKQGNKLVANLVIMGTAEEDDDGNLMVQVQVDTGTYGDARQFYNPEGEDAELTKEPDKYVMEVGQESKAGLLQNATQSHFIAYVARLRDMVDLMKGMAETQVNLRNKISEICSQEPVGIFAGGVDPEAEVSEYIERDKKAPKDAPPPPAE